MVDSFSNDDRQFSTHEIVCLEYKNTCLYAEVIQIIPAKNICWARPLVLVKLLPNQASFYNNMSEIKEFIDLRETTDLLLPINLFRPALDVETISLLTRLYNSENSKNLTNAKRVLNSLIKEILQTKKHLFIHR